MMFVKCTGKQISILMKESSDKLAQEHGITFEPGNFAENLKIEGINLLSYPIGTKIKAGEAVLEITQFGKNLEEVHTFNYKGFSILPTEGIFCRVLKSGTVKEGDEVTTAVE